MRKNHLIKLIRDSLSGKFMAFGLAAASLMFVSCTVDPLDKESYESDLGKEKMRSDVNIQRSGKQWHGDPGLRH